MNDIINTIETANTNTNNMTEKETTTMKKHSTKAIICTDTNETFYSIKEAAEHYGICNVSVSQVLHGKIKSTNGYHFIYVNESDKMVGCHKEVVCIDTNEVFKNCTEASRHFNIDKTSINKCCNGKQKSANGMHFRYADKSEITEKESTNMEKKIVNTSGHKGKKVMCIETNKVYSNIASAAKEIGCSHDLIGAVCHGRCKTAKGMHFKFVNNTEVTPTETTPEAPITPDIPKEILIQPKSIIKGKGKRTNGNTNAVLCISTGEVFTSCTDAAEKIGATVGHTSYACRHIGHTVKGKKVCYIKDINEHLPELAESIRKANMYDGMMTKEEKKKEMIANLKSLESKADSITYEISRLTEELAKTEDEIEKAKLEVIHFCFD